MTKSVRSKAAVVPHSKCQAEKDSFYRLNLLFIPFDKVPGGNLLRDHLCHSARPGPKSSFSRYLVQRTEMQTVLCSCWF